MSKLKFVFFASLLLCMVLDFAKSSFAATYYVANMGNDACDGTSSTIGASGSCAWKTITRVNAKSFSPGDSILFNKGDTWREQLTIQSSGSSGNPITFDAYGTGVSPIISGADTVTGWTNYSGNVWVATTSPVNIPNQLYVDGQFYDIAHYPASGYLTATANSTDTTSIIDANLALTPAQVVGATVLAKAVPWHLSTTVATAYDSSAGTIMVNGNVYSTTQIMRAKWGFYLQNMLWMLNAPRAWFYDASAGKLYLWTANSDDPNNHTVEISNRSYGIYSTRKNYVTIQNLAVVNANQYDVYVYFGDNVPLNNLSVSGGQMGIYAAAVTNSVAQNNTVQNTLSNGMHFLNVSNVNILNNTVNNAGNVGTSPKGSSAGIVAVIYNGSSNSNVTISGNTITNSGYNGIYYTGDQFLIQNNSIDKSCLVLDDCGGIYTSDGTSAWTSTISGNTISNLIGNFSGTAYTSSEAIGIYLDDLSHGYTVTNNTVSNSNNIGIFIHTGYNNTVTGNSVSGAKSYAFLINENTAGAPPGTAHDNVVTSNTFETISKTSATANYYNNLGTYNNNQYCHPNNPSFVISNQLKNYTLSAWQQFSGQDLNSTDSSSSTCTPIPPVTNTTTVTSTTSDGTNIDTTPPAAPTGLSAQ